LGTAGAKLGWPGPFRLVRHCGITVTRKLPKRPWM